MMTILKDWFGMLNQPNAPATFWLLTALRTACLVHNWFQTTQGYSTEELITAIKSYYCTISFFDLLGGDSMSSDVLEVQVLL